MDEKMNEIKMEESTSENQALLDLCKQHNVDYDDACKYKSKHPELSDEEVIQHFRPNLIINIFGELIDIEKYIKF